jgi:hypothetical protein
MPVHHASCKVRLQIRLEDFVPEVLTPETFDPFAALGPEAFGPGIYADVVGLRNDTICVDLIPYTATVELNSYRLADTAKCTIPFQRLPFDPRIIRSATLQVFGGTFTTSEFSAAMAPDAPGLLLPDVVPEFRPDAGTSNELFRGFVDVWKLKIPTNGNMLIDIEARDTTGPLLDAELPANALRDIPMNMRLDQVIQLLLTGDGAPTKELSRRFGLPGFRGITVVNEAGDGELVLDLPTVAEIRPPQWLSSAKTTKKGRKGGGSANGPKVTYWDAITDLCVSAGYIVYMRAGTTPIDVPGLGAVLPAAEIVISNPRTYYAQDRETGESLLDTDKTRCFIYGLNAEDLEIERKLTGTKTPTIEVLTYNTDNGQRMRARFPPVPVNNAPAVGSGQREEVKQFLLDEIGGPRAQERLLAAAKSIYEQLGRGEMQVTVTTKSLASRLSNFDDSMVADLFQLRAGETIRIEVDRKSFGDGVVPPFTLFTTASAPERIQGMVAMGVPIVVAARVALAMDSPHLQTEFRCTQNTLNFDHLAGWDATVRGVNYLDIRSDVAAIEEALAA